MFSTPLLQNCGARWRFVQLALFDIKSFSGSTNWSELDQAALEAKACCCLATLTGGKAIACGRPAFGIWFSNKLRQKALKKNLPFAYNKGVIILNNIANHLNFC